MNKPHLIIIATLLSAAHAASAITPAQVRWSGSPSDSTTIETLMTRSRIEAPRAGAPERIAPIALKLLGHPYAPATLEGTDPEQLTVRLDSLDCTTFIETAMALAITATQHTDPTWRDYIQTLESIRYRRGHLNGYPSRLHYISEWAIENTARGHLTEITSTLPAATYTVKTLDYMSRHSQAYPPLANPDNLAGIKTAEMGYRSHRYPIIKTSKVNAKTLSALRPGDIIAFTTAIDGLDIAHLGLIAPNPTHPDTPTLLHASSEAGQVTLSQTPLPEYLRRHRKFTGIRIFRLKPLTD